MSAEHQVKACAIQRRNEILADHHVAMPTFFGRRNMAERYPHPGVLIFITRHDTFQPFGFFLDVVLCDHDVQIPDVTVNLVLSRVEEQEEELPIRGRVVRPSG